MTGTEVYAPFTHPIELGFSRIQRDRPSWTKGLRSRDHRRVQHYKDRPGPIDRRRHVIDYTQDVFANGPQRYDIILDIGGN